MAKKVKPGKRLYLTADKEALVPEGDTRAAFLFCTEDSFVDESEYKRLKKPRQDKRSKAPTEDKGE